MALLETTMPVTSTITTSATLAAGQHSLVSASGAARTMTLPTPLHQGSRIRVEKVDGSGNVVTVVGTIRGDSSGTIPLTSQYQAIEFWAESLTSWRPINDRRTDESIQAQIDSSVTDDVTSTVASLIAGTAIVKTYTGSAWPTRPDTSATGQVVFWFGPASSAIAYTGTSSGGTAAAAPGDVVFYS